VEPKCELECSIGQFTFFHFHCKMLCGARGHIFLGQLRAVLQLVRQRVFIQTKKIWGKYDK